MRKFKLSVWLANKGGQILISNNYQTTDKYIATIQNLFFRTAEGERQVIGVGDTPDQAVKEVLRLITGLSFRTMDSNEYEKVPGLYV